MEKLIEGGGIDPCLSIHGVFEQGGVRWSHLLDEVLIIAMPRTHRLAAKRTLRMSELSSEPFSCCQLRRHSAYHLRQVCADSSLVPNIAFEAMNIGTLRGMIAAGLGIGLLPHGGRSKWKAEQKKRRREEALVQATGVRTLGAIVAAVPVRLMKRDLLFIVEHLSAFLNECRLEIIARQRGSKKTKNNESIAKLVRAFIRKADESDLGRLLVE